MLMVKMVCQNAVLQMIISCSQNKTCIFVFFLLKTYVIASRIRIVSEAVFLRFVKKLKLTINIFFVKKSLLGVLKMLPPCSRC